MSRPTPEDILKLLADRLSRKFADEGKLIEGGWMVLKTFGLSKNLPERQYEEMRALFYLGAVHLWTSMFHMLEEGTEPTAKDEERLSMISAEIDQWIKEEGKYRPDFTKN